ncbi:MULTISPECIES: DUF1828 domain-containing protein [unclassified Pannonibacter]|uniref:DUF1828 domain-containing protein n=1 Tax=unclassified Pannonibacter TaxID=2627228 RepID=UPI001645AFD8|nr:MULTISPECIES: DUF1828 domain-containing protein [unclassified Pannonibacter]
MTKSIIHLVDDYRGWLADKTQVRELTQGWHEITTPFVDHHNDMIQLYVKRKDDQIIITDDGYVINDLADSGCEVDSSPKRKALLTRTLNGFGVTREGRALTVIADENTFAFKKHSLLQSILAVSDMFMLAQSNVTNLFVEDVYGWLDEHDIRYTARAKFSGQTGFDHVFEAVIPKSRSAPERLLKAISNPSRDRVESAIFAWSDTRGSRPDGAKLYTLINDQRSIPVISLDALEAYGITSIRWSEREKFAAALAA